MNDIKSIVMKRIKDYQISNNLRNHNYIRAAYMACNWIERHTILGNGIVITSKERKIYEEVTGYYIPTLLQWGMRDYAIKYARYLCSVQQENGAWRSNDLSHSSVFNTGQVLRGLYAIADILPEVEDNMFKACDWLLSRVDSEGRLCSTDGTVWPDNGVNSECIHLYCLPPLYNIGEKYGRTEYIDAVKKVKDYYLHNYKEDIDSFNYLSHFYAYILEALVDLGEEEIVFKAMNHIRQIQRFDGSVPAYKDKHWVCSTGLFQLAIVWFKLGDYKHGNRAFDYAVSLQNQSGGWYGGYVWPLNACNTINNNEKVTYFPNEEISWAVKYFFDALDLRQKMEFQEKASTFIDYIDLNDDKYQIIDNIIKKMDSGSNILDVGCGKGRYLKKLFINYPHNKYYGVDLSSEVLRYISNDRIELKEGSILHIPYDDSSFDVVYAAEALEHAILIENGVKEMARVLKENGFFIVIDKDSTMFDQIKYEKWVDPDECKTKQWLNKTEIVNCMKNAGLEDVRIETLSTGYKSMYLAFIGIKAVSTENRF